MNDAGLAALEIDDIAALLNTSWIDVWQVEEQDGGPDEPSRPRLPVESVVFRAACPHRRLTRRSGGTWSSRQSSDSDKRPVQLLAVSRDVTEQKRMEDCLARCRPAQGRVPGDACPRAAKSAFGDQQRGGSRPATPVLGGRPPLEPGGHSAAGQASVSPYRRPARHLADHPRQDRIAAGIAGRQSDHRASHRIGETAHRRA